MDLSQDPLRYRGEEADGNQLHLRYIVARPFRCHIAVSEIVQQIRPHIQKQGSGCKIESGVFITPQSRIYEQRNSEADVVFPPMQTICLDL